MQDFGLSDRSHLNQYTYPTIFCVKPPRVGIVIIQFQFRFELIRVSFSRQIKFFYQIVQQLQMDLDETYISAVKTNLGPSNDIHLNSKT